MDIALLGWMRRRFSIFFLIKRTKKNLSLLYLALLSKLSNQSQSLTRSANQYYIDHATPCPQTVTEQHYLLSSLKKEKENTLENEADLLALLMANPNAIFNKNDTIGLCSGWKLGDLASILPSELSIQSFDLDNMQDVIQHLIVCNPYLATLLLLQPTQLKRVAQKIKGNLIFPIYANTNPLQLEWGDTFGEAERNEEHYWRWALANAEAHVLILTNNTPNTQKITLKLTIWTADDATNASLKCYFLDECIEHNVHYNAQIEMKLSLPPGRHRLRLVYNGKTIQSAHDFRVLHFALADLAINNVACCASTKSYFSPISDITIRNVLHESGFFEVSAFAQNVSDLTQKALLVTRFHMANKHYMHKASEAGQHKTDVIWYYAKRAATFKEGL